MKRYTAVLCLVAALAGCRTTAFTAITSDREADACQRLCPNTGSEESLLNCLRSCPGTGVFEDQTCDDTQLAQGQRCAERNRDQFSMKRTLILIGSIVGGAALAGGAILMQEVRWGGL